MKKTPFEIKYERQRLAQQSDLKELKRMYSSKHPEILDLNTKPFWNEPLSQRKPFSQAG